MSAFRLSDAFPFSSLKWKMALFAGSVLVLSCLVLGAFLWVRHAVALTDNLLEQGEVLARHLAVTGRYSLITRDTTRLSELIEGAFQTPDVAYVVFTDSTAGLIASRGRPIPSRANVRLPPDALSSPGARATIRLLVIRDDQAVPEPSAPLISWHTVIPWLCGATTGRLYDVAVPVSRPAAPSYEDDRPFSQEGGAAAPETIFGAVHVGLSDHLLRASLLTSARLAGLILLLVVTAGVAATLLLARSLTGPLVQLSHSASRIGAGKLDVTAVPHGQDEIGHLTRVFNSMTRSLRDLTEGLEAKVHERTLELQVANDKLKELDRVRTRFVSTASHELRTPLTSIKVYVDNLLDGVEGAMTSAQQQVLRRVEDNLARLRQLVEDLLDLSRIESGATRLTLAPLSLLDLLRRTTDSLVPIASQKQIAFSLDVPADLPVLTADSAKLKQVLTNLLDNAVKFSPVGESVRITAGRAGEGSLLIQIADAGCGIPPEDLEYVFLPFFRSPRASELHPGAGLGLSIAHQLVQLHGGTLTAASTVGHGSTFSLTLPLQPPTAVVPTTSRSAPLLNRLPASPKGPSDAEVW